MDANERRKRERWQRLYDRLLLLMSNFGREDSYGRADFFIVDDYSEGQQKVYITSWAMLGTAFLAPLMKIVKEDFSDFEIYVQVDVDHPDGTPSNARGVIVRSCGVEDCLDRSELPEHIRATALRQ